MTARTLVGSAAMFLLVTAGAASAQKAQKCSDIPVSVQILSFDADGDGVNDSALAGDAKGAVYTDGADGVYNTVIHVCGSAPSYDATMGLVTSRRSLGFRFPPPTDGSLSPGPAPVWADGATFLARPFLNVRRILWGRLNGVPTFTTRMNISSITGPGDKASYTLLYAPSSPDSGVPGNPDANIPEETVGVTVQDVPGTCRSGGSVLDSWVVTAAAPSVAALMRNASGGALVQAGQYVMPFQLLISAKKCLPF